MGNDRIWSNRLFAGFSDRELLSRRREIRRQLNQGGVHNHQELEQQLGQLNDEIQGRRSVRAQMEMVSGQMERMIQGHHPCVIRAAHDTVERMMIENDRSES